MEPVTIAMPRDVMNDIYITLLDAESHVPVAPKLLMKCLNWLEDERGFKPPVRNGWIVSKEIKDE